MSVAIFSLVGDSIDRITAKDFDAQFAGNTGNALIQLGLEELLPKATTTDDLVGHEFEDVDYIVIGLANFLSSFPMTKDQTTMVEKISRFITTRKNVKVIVASVGCDFASIFSAEQIDKKRLDFIRTIASNSEFIGARGFLTAEVLNDLGVNNIWVVGCPAFSFPLVDREGEQKSLVNNGLVVGWKPDGHLRSFYGNFLEWAAHHEATCIVQESGENLQIESADDHLVGSLGLDDFLKYYGWPKSDFSVVVKQWLLPNSRWAPTYGHWQSIMAGQRLSVNCRIHGTAAAIASGVKALHINVDSRTTELSQFHLVPNVNYKNFWFPSDLDEIEELTSNTLHLKNRSQYHKNFNSFFTANGIDRNQLLDANWNFKGSSVSASGIGIKRITNFQSGKTKLGLRTFEKMLTYRLESEELKDCSKVGSIVSDLLVELGCFSDSDSTRLFTHFAPQIVHGLNLQANPKLASLVSESLGFLNQNQIGD
jgi:hypothetical protein